MLVLSIFFIAFVVSVAVERAVRWFVIPRLLPELALFPVSERKRAAKPQGRLYSWVQTAIIYGILLMLWPGGKTLFGSIFMLPAWAFFPTLGFLLISLLLAPSLLPVLVARNSMRRGLRKRLVELGMPVCISCGYDLRGQMEPRCPECGTEVITSGAGVQGLQS